MTDAWIVVREEKHIDDKFWVCLDRNDALRIAADVTAYWKDQYGPELDCIDEECYGNQIFHYDVEEMFRVVVKPQEIRDVGEYMKEKEDDI